MEQQTKREIILHRLLILILWIGVVGGISLLLYNISYNPNFSAADALSGATKKTQNRSGRVLVDWKYTKKDIDAKDQKYIENEIKISDKKYKLLKKDTTGNKKNTLILLSNKENESYQKAVNEISNYYTNQGYKVRVKKTTETMMLSMAHAGKFDVFLMSEEEAQ